MKTISSCLLVFLSACFTSLFAQALVPFGGFDQWKTDSTELSYAPYSSSNADALLFSDTVNAYPVSNGIGGEAVHLETLPASNNGLIAGSLEFGSFRNGFLYGGEGYSDQPDSVYFRLRYDIQPGDSGLIYVSFRSNPTISVVQAEIYLAGTETNWLTLGYDLDAFTDPTDSLSIQIYSSSPWFAGTPAAGSWIEVDTVYFSGTAAPVSNAGFQTSTQPFYKPVGWYSSNRLSQAILPGRFNATPDSLNCAQNVPYSLRLETMEVGSDTVLGFAFNGQNYNIDGPHGGQAWTIGNTNYNSLQGWYQYVTPSATDTGIISLTVWAWDNGVKTEEAFHQKFAPTATCTNFELVFQPNFTPDSFRIYMASSDLYNEASSGYYAHGSTLNVDGLRFDLRLGSNSIRDELQATDATLTLFPNPAKDYVNIIWENKYGDPQRILIYDMNGRIRQQVGMSELPRLRKNTLELSLEGMIPGVYILMIQDESGRPLGRKQLVIR